MDKRKEKLLEEIKNNRCQYPMQKEEGWALCGEKQMMTVSLPIINQTENGELEASEGLHLGAALCNYHCMLAMSTGMFGVKSDIDLKTSRVVAPVDIIHIVESVISTMILTGKFQEQLKEKEKMDKELAEVPSLNKS